ncbi:MAG: hydrogenase maturation protease [Candidatus Fervidibacter sp.]|uniref:hydrogenase maturation protease n=1 Tax=Candidatus Fervidibacter sp. TaxID=3100871 RepID=UPI004049DA73
MPKALIIGYGNILRGDDGVGWAVAERLKGLLLQESVTVQTNIQLTPEMAVDLSEVELVVFIDAQANEPAGAVTCQPVEPLTVSSPSFSHHLTAATLLSLALHLFGKAPKAYLVSINGANFEYREGLSPPVQNAVLKAIKTVLNLLMNANLVNSPTLTEET